MNIPAVFQPGWKWCGIALLLGALLGAWASWWVTDNKFNADIAMLKSKHAAELLDISTKAQLDYQLNATMEHAVAVKNAASDLRHTQELTDALAKNQALRDAVTSSARQLRLAKAGLATCNLSKSAVAGSSSMDDAGTITFSNDFGRNILDIRAGIISDQQKLKALQDYIRAGQDAGVIAK